MNRQESITERVVIFIRIGSKTQSWITEKPARVLKVFINSNAESGISKTTPRGMQIRLDKIQFAVEEVIESLYAMFEATNV